MLKKHIKMKTLNEDFILQLLPHFILNRNRETAEMRLVVGR
jgi:hypothetical protein